MDPLSDVLKSVRLVGSVFYDGFLTAPWTLISPTSEELAKHLMPGASHLVQFHLVSEGSCVLQMQNGLALSLFEGDMVLIPNGDMHRMGSEMAKANEPLVYHDYGFPPPGVIGYKSWGGGGLRTGLVCGYLAVDRHMCKPILESLPSALRVPKGSTEAAGWMASYLRLSRTEKAEGALGMSCALGKLAELMFIEAIRYYCTSLPEQAKGWLKGLTHPIVGKAVTLLHQSPTANWTLDRLAREVSVSRTKLSKVFVECMGISPMAYLLQHRLIDAARMLDSTDLPASAIGYRVGYESEAAFNRAFRRMFGLPPSAWRAERRRTLASTEEASTSGQSSSGFESDQSR